MEGEKITSHRIPVVAKLRWHSEKDQKWIRDIEHISLVAEV